MKSAHIIRRLSFQAWGGTESVVFNSVLELNACGHSAEILATQALCDEKHTIASGVDIHRFNYFYPYFPMTEQRQLALDKKGGNPYAFDLFDYLMQHDFDLLHTHTMGRLANIVRRVAHKKKIPYVMSFHGGCFDIPEAEKKAILSPLKWTFRYGYMLDHIFGLRHDAIADADGLICVGHHEFELAKKNFPNKEVIYLPNGVNAVHFSTPTQINFREKYQIPSDRKIMLCVSRIDYQKNQLALIETLQALRQIDASWYLVLIGPITADWYAQKISKKIDELQLNEHVLFLHGFAPNSMDLVSAYQAADLFMLPSVHEPFGIVLLEAMAASCPILASPVGGIKYLISDRENGLLVDFSDPEEVAQKAMNLFSEEGVQLREKMVTNALKEVHEKYTWQVITQRLLVFYERVCARKK